MEYAENEDEQDTAKEKNKGRLNAMVAITVAILATFMGICKVKDDNIVQQMQQDQANKIDYFAWVQAKKTREKLSEGHLDDLQLRLATASAVEKPILEKQLASTQTYITEEKGEIKKLEEQAKGFEDDYNSWNVHDDQFDMSDAALAIAISLLALTSLTQKRWLFGVAMAPTVFGVLLGLAGLFHWTWLHPNAFAKFLGT